MEVEDVAVVFRLVFLEEGLFEPYFTAYEALRLGDGIHVVEFDDVGGVVADGESVFGDEKERIGAPSSRRNTGLSAYCSSKSLSVETMTAPLRWWVLVISPILMQFPG